MPLYVLKIKCDLENLSKLFSHPGTTWKFDVESDSGETREGITFCAEDVMELDGSRGIFTFFGNNHKFQFSSSYLQSYFFQEQLIS